MSKALIVDGAAGALDEVVAHLCAGQPVAIPTETVYGLAANAMDGTACARIFAAKKRPTDNPLIVHISSLDQLHCKELGLVRRTCNDKADIPEKLHAVMQAFWPGPLTLLLPKGSAVPDAVSAGLSTVAVRFPSHPVAQKIIQACGFPLAAPSANLSGRPSPTTAQHVLADLGDRIAYVVDGGACLLGLESTVLDGTQDPPLILRPGSVTLQMLQPLLPNVQLFSPTNCSAQKLAQMMERPSTPGMKYRHYAPQSPVHLFHQRNVQVRERLIGAFVDECVSKELLVVRLVIRARTAKQCSWPAGLYKEIELASADSDYRSIARNLFGALRAADALQPAAIVAESVSASLDNGECVCTADDVGEAVAIMNRLEKAASVHVRE